MQLSFFFNDTATTEIYTLSLHDALPIWDRDLGRSLGGRGRDSGGSVALPVRPGRRCPGAGQPVQRDVVEDVVPGEIARRLPLDESAGHLVVAEIGRAACRERVEISVVAVSLKKNKEKYS